VIGSGTNTFGKENREYQGAINDDTTELLTAIKLGYRHFDTAISYRNEAVVGKAIKESGIDRSEFFLTSKIPGKPEHTQDAAAVKASVEASLAALQTESIDLYLIHHPWDNLAEIAAVWAVLEAYVDKGVLKAIGVSNFQEEELSYLLANSRIKPAVNQIESHPGKWNDAILASS
ncbi:aldo/keto reductase, partial [Pseudomonas monteilii]|nr:aldo/keto reductase [Pseudomonas monteilii]